MAFRSMYKIASSNRKPPGSTIKNDIVFSKSRTKRGARGLGLINLIRIRISKKAMEMAGLKKGDRLDVLYHDQDHEKWVIKLSKSKGYHIVNTSQKHHIGIFIIPVTNDMFLFSDAYYKDKIKFVSNQNTIKIQSKQIEFDLITA